MAGEGSSNAHTRGTIERLRKERREILNRMKEEVRHTGSGTKWCEGWDLIWILEQVPKTIAHPVEQYMCMIM